MKGKSAIVTGSTSGIGLGIAEAYASNGVNVMLNGFGDTAEIEEIRARIAAEHGVSCLYSGADMSKPDQVRGMVADCEKEFGTVDILVNNAGIQFVSPIQDFPDDRWDAVIAINLSSAFHAIKAALPGMLDRDWGRIINVASAHGHVASMGKAAYVSSKHGILGLTKVVALETATTGVTCNAICPGWVLTPLVKKQIEDRAAEAGRSFDAESELLLGEKQPSKQFATPEHMGAAAVFLASDAAEQMTGATMNIDGGWLAQ